MAASANSMPSPMKKRGILPQNPARGRGNQHDTTRANRAHPTLTGVVEDTYTTAQFGQGGGGMAFVRRIGKGFYLVHNVRRRGKVKQLHLAPLGERPRITDDVMRSVSRNYPLLKLNWNRLREKVNDRVEVFDAGSDFLKKLSRSILSLNLDLADLAPPMMEVAPVPDAGRDVVTQLRLLRSTVEVKLDQLDRAKSHGLVPRRRFR